MNYDTAGDPMTGLKWTRRTTVKIAAELERVGIKVSPKTVAKLLKRMGFSLRVNHKKRSTGSPPERDAQFEYIAALRKEAAADGTPIISIDTKKKELVGQFKNPGTAWGQAPVHVNDHDFPSDADGKAIPYGILDLQANRGTFFVGTTRDTPEFAVDCVERWWRTEGRQRYPHSSHLVVLADSGGSNGARCRAWKHGLHQRLCNRHGISITLAHYPPGASKWNPIEHRLFAELSKNWAGRPLDSYETILKYMRTTTTSTGLRVRAHLVKRKYKTGIKITDAQMRQTNVDRHEVHPQWNYTINPGLPENGK